MKHLLAVALLSCAALANAQDVLIRGATVHTVGEQGVLTNTDVLIRDGKIAAVGTGLSAPAGGTTVDANGRALTPGLFGGLSAIGVEEVSLESTTADASVILNAPAFETQWRPEFDVTNAYNPRSVLVPVARVEGLTWTMLAPGSAEGGTFLAGQGAAVTLDGRYDAVLAGSRALFINLGGNSNALSAGSRAGQWMLLDQAIRETRSPSTQDEHLLMHPLGREALAKISGRRPRRVRRLARGGHPPSRRIRETQRHEAGDRGGAEAWVVADELAREKCRCCSMRSRICPTRSTGSVHGWTTPRCCTRPACASRSRSSTRATTRAKSASSRATPSRMDCPRMRRSPLSLCSRRRFSASRASVAASRAARSQISCSGAAIRSK